MQPVATDFRMDGMVVLVGEDGPASEGATVKISTRLTGLEHRGDHVDVSTDGARFQVYLLDENIIRIRSTFKDEFPEELNYALVKTAWDDATDELMAGERERVDAIEPHVEEPAEGVYEMSTGKYTLRITSEPFVFEVLDADGNVLHADLPGRSFMQDSLGRPTHYVKMGDHNHFYGFGEKSGELNKIRRRMRMHNVDSLGWDASKSDPLYKMIPFYINFDAERNLTHGLFYNNSADSVFDMDCEHSNYWLRYSYFQAEAGDIDLYFIGGPTIKDVVEHYTDLTGKTAMMPLSSLGYMGSTMFYTELDKDCDKAVGDFVDTCAKYGIPVDGFFLSSGYTSGEDGKRYVFNWNYDRFPDPKAFIETLEDKGVQVSPNIKPGMLNTHHLTDDFEQARAYVRTSDDAASQVDRYWGGPAHFVDFTSPAGRAKWSEHMTKQLLANGIRWIWNDNNEYEIADNDAIAEADGLKRPIGELKPLMSTLMAKTAHTAIEAYDPDVRPYVTNRAGYAGIQRYAQTWCGDNGTTWTNLKYNVSTILGMGLSGVANQGADIGGFDGHAPEPELFVRWVQNGVFQPRFSIHSCNTDNTVTEPWMYPEYTYLIADAIRLRYQLAPYFYSLLHEASVTGAPIMRPLVYEFQHDPKAWDESFEFMLGPSLLIANVLDKGVDSIDVYLPSGADWYDFETRRWLEGGQTVTVPVTLASIPMFLRSGGLVPQCPGLTNLHNQTIDHLTLLVEPGEHASFTLYEDDGVSRAYERGEMLETAITVTPSAEGVDVDFAPKGSYKTRVETMQLEVLCRRIAPLSVEVAGRSIERFLNYDKFLACEEGWFFDGQTRKALVRYATPDGAYRTSLVFKAKDLVSI